jgi:hypothetical protein
VQSGLTCGSTTGVPGGLPAFCTCSRSSLCSAPTGARAASGARAFSPATHLALSALCRRRPLQVCSNGLHVLRAPVAASPAVRIVCCPARQAPGRGAAGGQCVGAHHCPVRYFVIWQCCKAHSTCRQCPCRQIWIEPRRACWVDVRCVHVRRITAAERSTAQQLCG